ncbi:hypothetical protein GCM10010106_19890 [Thermopolyspora flexuosa]|uniref:DUF309 family protein family protein n=2 Tax=Thermopolyspora flexuosa TaxID=103836 RepID=A0A543J3L9_9ACTN|nr:DUF309 family protein family protein [Thermopolyspora flexuosa]GGM73362.1 hypothetical protein GCM10010106_19890 [Thermopolyspora flexuosa]
MDRNADRDVAEDPHGTIRADASGGGIRHRSGDGSAGRPGGGVDGARAEDTAVGGNVTGHVGGGDPASGTGKGRGGRVERDRDEAGRPRNARPRDAFGRPLPHGAKGIERVPDDYAPSAEEAVRAAIGHLDDGHPFLAHEVFESRWKCGPAEERDLWQGLAQICVGLTHLQRGNTTGAAALLTRGADRVTAYGTREPYGMDLAETVGVARTLAGSATAAADAIAAIRRALRPGTAAETAGRTAQR